MLPCMGIYSHQFFSFFGQVQNETLRDIGIYQQTVVECSRMQVRRSRMQARQKC